MSPGAGTFGVRFSGDVVHDLAGGKMRKQKVFFYHVLSVMVKLWSSYGNHHVISPCFFMVISPW